jgi:DNA-binding CsgD family transcriptional regulator
MIMYFSVFLIVFSALFVTVFSRMPEKQRGKKKAIRVFVFLYILKYGLLALEPVWGKPFGILSGAMLLILANTIPVYWLKVWFVKHYAEGYDEETRRNLSDLVQAYGISNRELEIIELILKGKSNKEIEDMLFISFSTVKNHIYNIYQKMGINSRGQLMAMVINHPEENN